MRKVGGPYLKVDKIDAVVASAAETLGVPMYVEEVRLLTHIAAEARRDQVELKRARRHVEELAVAEGATAEMAPVIGKTTSAVLVAAVGDPTKFGSADAYEKALGLNLKEKSSGQLKGALHITKRGSGVARLFLYMAALRLITSEPVIRAWYAKKVRRQALIRRRSADAP